jgi:hypothetical protein
MNCGAHNAHQTSFGITCRAIALLRFLQWKVPSPLACLAAPLALADLDLVAGHQALADRLERVEQRQRARARL